MPRTVPVPPAVAFLLTLLLAAPATVAQSAGDRPAPSGTVVPAPQEQAAQELERQRAGDNVETLTGPEAPVTTADPGVGVTGGDWAAETAPPASADGRRPAGAVPGGAPGVNIADDPAADPPLPDVPEAIGEEMQDQGISGVDAPLPGSAETGQAASGRPSAGRSSSVSGGRDGG
ncbi:hypothetical protein [Rhodocista pekingensis]|uniref:Uncharacterized protein n=1 Tax=Rhodocista pekingensis TaxID=201185 RepID=A0ABW2KVK4_9PROT